MPATPCTRRTDAAFGPTVNGCRNDFDFTILFEDAFFSIVPSAIFLAVVPLNLGRLLQKPTILRSGWLQPCKLAATSLFLVSQVASLVILTVSYDAALKASIAAAALSLAAASAICVLSLYNHRRSIRPSTLLQVYLVFSLVLDIPRARTIWLQDPDSALGAILTCGLALKLVLVVCEAVEKRSLLAAYNRVLPPETTIGVLNRSVYWWLNSLLLTGVKRAFSFEDVYMIDSQLTSHAVHEKLMQQWTNTKPDQTRAVHGLLVATAVAFKWPLLRAVAPRIALLAFKYTQPFLINALLGLLDEDQSPSTRLKGRGMIVAYILVYVGIAVSQGRYWHRTFRAITMVRGSLISAISAKQLTLSASSAQATSGFTLISTDVERICASLRNMHEAWANILELGIAIWLLERQLGVACVAPVVVVIACTSGTLVMARYVQLSQKAWLQALQKRLTLTSTVLGNVKSVKLMGLASRMSAMLTQLRNEELLSSLKFRKLLVWSVALSEATTMLAPSATFLVFSIIALVQNNSTLLTARAFTSLAVLSLLGTPLATLIQAVPNLLAAVACFKRIQEFLDLPTHVDQRRQLDRLFKLPPAPDRNSWNRPSTVADEDLASSAAGDTHSLALPILDINGADISWSTGAPLVLRAIDCKLQRSQLMMVTGPVASGKTTLLKACLGEAVIEAGYIHVATKDVAFCDQTTWLQQGSVSEQVTSGNELDRTWYSTVIAACDLAIDIASLPNKECTQIGNKGDKLSGGQRQRLAIARAVYSRARLMVFDDVLSALDVTTANRVFAQVFGPNGLLRRMNTTVLLATQAYSMMSQADYLLVLGDTGDVAQHGSFAEVSRVEGYVNSLATKSQEKEFLKASESTSDKAVEEDASAPKAKTEQQQGPEQDRVIGRDRRAGDMVLYKHYAKAAGRLSTVLSLVLLVISAFCLNFPTLFLEWWSSANLKRPNQDIGMYLGVYCMLGVLSLLSLTAACWILLQVMVPRSGRAFHSTVVKTTMWAPLNFFSETDVGETTNRFSQDMQLIDTQLPLAALNTFEALASSLVQLALICATASYTAIAIPACIACVYGIQRLYLKTSRQIRLIEIEAKSPLYSFFLGLSEGLPTIRAFSWQERILATASALLDRSQQPFYLLYCIQQWLTFVLDMLVGVLATLVVAIAVEVPGAINAGSAGVALVTVLNCNQTLTNLITYWTMMETSLGAVARVLDFGEHTPSEAGPDRDVNAPKQWPREGRIEITSLTASHQRQSAPVLTNVSLSIEPGHRVGICGRTGSGKSSLVLALFQMLEVQSGSIRVDGVDLSQLHVDDVRSAFTAVPQDPLLFPLESVRSNLNVEREVADKELVGALDRVGVWDTIAAKGGLDTLVGGLDLSHGQRQLFCLARAMVSDSRVVILDETTASVDADTNHLVQRLLKTSLQGRTIVSIEHRLYNLADCDRVAVMDGGRLVEYDDPKKLLQCDSAFRRLHGEVNNGNP